MKFVFFLLIFSVQWSFGQRLDYVGSVPLVADKFIGIDNYGTIYTIKDRVFHKRGQDGNFIYNSLQLGRITSADIINPLKIVVFFQETNTVVFLDNKLNEIERINFNHTNPIINAASATTAGSNSLWIYNSDTQQLELYNYKSRKNTTVSQPFPGALVAQAGNFNYCFILTSKKLWAFNVYGSFLNRTEAEGFSEIRQEQENVLLLKHNQLYLIPNFAAQKSKSASEMTVLELPEINIVDFQPAKDFVYIFDGKELHTFKLTIPKKD